MSPDGILGRVRRPFRQVDVFSSVRHGGNPVAVVLDGAGLSTEAMQGFANWMNLSETTFVLPPTATGADYRVRIWSGSLLPATRLARIIAGDSLHRVWSPALSAPRPILKGRQRLPTSTP
jgi:hypothetical protein